MIQFPLNSPKPPQKRISFKFAAKVLTAMVNTYNEVSDGGVRMTWNVWPRTKVEASKCVIPIAASISPIRYHRNTNPYAPLRCDKCSAVLNTFCRVNFPAWICSLCFQTNHFHPPVYVFVLDTCMIEEEFGFAKSALQQALEVLPENAWVGFVSFGTQVRLHELGHADTSKACVFGGLKETTKNQILDKLGLNDVPGEFPNPGVTRFLLPASEAANVIRSLLEELGTDQSPVLTGCISKRCTGAALSVAAGLLGACLPGNFARIVALVGGPCTEGPGMIVSRYLPVAVRSLQHIRSGPYYSTAIKFYEELERQMVNQGHVLDLFASAFDQVGVEEWKDFIGRTGGAVVLSESFGHSLFKDSFKLVFEKGEESLVVGNNGMLKVNCSKDTRFQNVASTTIEYDLPNHEVHQTLPPPVVVFMLDTSMNEKELGFAKLVLKQVLESSDFRRRYALVGFISFGTQVKVHELGFESKVCVFDGLKEMTKDVVLDQLGLGEGSQNREVTRFIRPVSEGSDYIYALLKKVRTDQLQVTRGKRSLRCTGVALRVAAGLLGACRPGTGARIVALVGGPCTKGPGSIVSENILDLPSYKDPRYKNAVQYYEKLAKQMVGQGHVLDLFASSSDQVGVAAMKVVIERTGGGVVLSESFGHLVFKESFKRFFGMQEVSLGLVHNGTLEINCSKDIRIQGIIGPCTSLDKEGLAVASTSIGQGNTTAWKLCGLDKYTCLTVFFDVLSSDEGPSGNANQQLYIQIVTCYQNADGEYKMRVTTITRSWVESAITSEQLMQGFDQETAAVVMARLISYKMEIEEKFDATSWLDRNLIRLCSKFGDYRKDDPSSFSLNRSFSLFPWFMFYLRRSQFVQKDNSDEAAYFRMLLNRESIKNVVVMIRPSLISFSVDPLPSPTLFDVASLADRILLMDSYFSVVIFHGLRIAEWRNMGHQNQRRPQTFADLLLQASFDDAERRIHVHFPAPRLVVCDQNGYKAILARLFPSNNVERDGMDDILPVGVDFQVFSKRLRRLAVQSS